MSSASIVTIYVGRPSVQHVKGIYWHSLIIRIYSYIKSGSSCEEEVILCHHISTVAKNVDLLEVL